MIKNMSLLSMLVFALALIAAPTPVNARHSYDDDCRRCGTVRSVERISYGDRRYNGDSHRGAVIGAIIGGAVGNRVGDGDHRRASTVGGAIIGGAIGNNIDRRDDRGNDDRRYNNRGHNTAYRISVRSDRGRIFTFDQRRSFGLRPGDRVELDNGEVRPFYRN